MLNLIAIIVGFTGVCFLMGWLLDTIENVILNPQKTEINGKEIK